MNKDVEVIAKKAEVASKTLSTLTRGEEGKKVVNVHEKGW